MSGISEVLSDDELSTFGDGADVTGSAPQWQVAKLVTEIIRLRAENKELRASYERVEKYAQDLLQERQILAAIMVPRK